MQRWARVPLFALLVAGTPILFSMTKDWHLDRRIGELSYPLYVSHFLVIWVVAYFFADQSAYLARATVIAGVILAALALRLWVDVPVDRFRQARLEKRAAGVPGKPEGCIEDEAGLRGAALPASAGK
jgi:peptidoglycan/LPS O-acetylase OafA/YrhL